MKAMKKSIYFSFMLLMIISFSASKVYSQGFTMYHMYNMSQKQQFNPALAGDFNFHLGIPGASTIGIEMNFAGFKIGSLIENINDFSNSIEETNYFNQELQVNLFSLGFKAGKNYFTFDANLRNSLHMSLKKDLVLFLTSGNGQFIDETATFTGTSISETLYMEYGIGYSRTLFDRLTVGGKFKYLNGIANLSLTDWEAGVYTAPVTYEMDIFSRGTVNVSAPVDFVYDADNNLIIEDSKPIDDPSRLLNEYLLKNKNSGFGVDLGASFKVSDRLLVSASVIDFMNTLTWNQNINQLSQDGEFHFSGIEVSGDSSFQDSDPFGPILDTLANSFQLTSSANSYTSSLQAKYYAGVSYKLLDGLSVGGLVHGLSFEDKAYLTYTLSANAKLWSFLSATVSASKAGSGGLSYGAGIAIKVLPIQIFVIGENINGLYYDLDYPMVWPGDISHAYFRFGANIVLGAKKDEKK
jgi:hypothetical protein